MKAKSLTNSIPLIVLSVLMGLLQLLQISFATSPSPYIDKQSQTIKALSQQQIQQLLSGEGMGLALAAELNEHPGPKHVLELQNELSLSKQQLERSQNLFTQMQYQAKIYGEYIVQAESELERLFQTGKARPMAVEQLVEKIALAQSKLRSLHLVTHIHQLHILTPQQNRHYQQLRGYSSSSKNSQHSKQQKFDSRMGSHQHAH